MCTKQTGKKNCGKLFGLCSKRFNLCGLSVSWCIDWQESRQSDNPLKVCFHLLLKFYQMKNGGFISKTTAAPLSLQVSKSDEFLLLLQFIFRSHFSSNIVVKTLLFGILIQRRQNIAFNQFFRTKSSGTNIWESFSTLQCFRLDFYQCEKIQNSWLFFAGYKVM